MEPICPGSSCKWLLVVFAAVSLLSSRASWISRFSALCGLLSPLSAPLPDDHSLAAASLADQPARHPAPALLYALLVRDQGTRTATRTGYPCTRIPAEGSSPPVPGQIAPVIGLRGRKALTTPCRLRSLPRYHINVIKGSSVMQWCSAMHLIRIGIENLFVV